MGGKRTKARSVWFGSKADFSRRSFQFVACGKCFGPMASSNVTPSQPTIGNRDEGLRWVVSGHFAVRRAVVVETRRIRG